MNSIERRSEERIESAQPANVYLEDGTSFPCTIEDFCGQGMLISFSGDHLGRSANIRILRVSFHPDAGAELFVNAQPIHVSGGSAGLRFSSSYPQVVSYLNKRYGRDTTQTVLPEYKAIAEYCLVETEAAIMPMIEEVLPQIVAAFREEAIGAATDQDANEFMSIAEKLEKHGKLVLSKAHSELIRIESLAPSTSASETNTVAHSGSSDLSIIEKLAFEDWLISRVLITKLEANFRTPLLLLKMRTDHMSYLSPVNGSPLGPERAVYAFRTAIHQHIGNTRLEKRAFKIFEQVALQSLGALYDKLNEVLESEGVLANAKLGVKKEIVKPKSPKPDVQRAAEQASEPESEQEQELKSALTPPLNDEASTKPLGPKVSPDSGDVSAPATGLGYGGGQLNHAGIQDGNISALDLANESSSGASSGLADEALEGHAPSSTKPERPKFSSLGKMLRRFRAKEQTTDVVDEALELFSSNEVDDGLSKLHGQTRIAEDDAAALSLLERVMSGLEIEGQPAKALGIEHKDRIDVVDKFFVSLNNNPRLSIEGKQHLFRLEIPVLRQLLENEDFFDGSDSPLRDVLNRVARLGAQGGRLGRVGHQKIEKLIVRINEEYDDNKGVLDEVKQQLDALLEKQHALYLKNVERVAAAADGAHKVEHTRQKVAQFLQDYLVGKEVPLALVSLLDSGWREHLSLTALKYGIDSADFKSAFDVVEALVLFGADPNVGFDARRYVPQIQDGLQYLTDGAAGIKHVREELKQLLLDAQNNRHAMVPAPYIENVSVATEQDREQINLEKSKRLHDWIQKAKMIPLNSWLRLQKDAHAPTQFIRLVWIAKGYSKFVFVNHQGLKVVELGLFKLAEYLKDQKVSPDPKFNQPIVQQGLDDMVKEVYDRLAHDSSHDQQSGLPNLTEFKRTMRFVMQSGERTRKCCLVYIRCLTGELESSAEAQVVRKVADAITHVTEDDQKASVRPIYGRLNHYDYGVFISGPESKHEVERLQAQLMRVNDDIDTVGYGVSILCSEVWGYLGFHNQEQLFESGAQNLEHLGEGKDLEVAKLSQCAVELPKGEPVNQSPVFDSSELSTFTVYSQAVRKLSSSYTSYAEGTELDSHRSLKCKANFNQEPDTSTTDFYTPNTYADGDAFDAWWLIYLSKGMVQQPQNNDVYRIPLIGRSLENQDYIRALLALVEVALISPRGIIFELMACAEISNLHHAADAMRELQILGFRFSLDGFGTPDCPSSLIQSLPVDGVAVAANFLENNIDDEQESDAAESLVDVAHHFSKIVFACEVDSAIAMQKVGKLDVDFVQGNRVDAYKEST